MSNMFYGCPIEDKNKPYFRKVNGSNLKIPNN